MKPWRIRSASQASVQALRSGSPNGCAMVAVAARAGSGHQNAMAMRTYAAVASAVSTRRPAARLCASGRRHLDAPPLRGGCDDRLDHRLHSGAVVERRDRGPPLLDRGDELRVLIPAERLLRIDTRAGAARPCRSAGRAARASPQGASAPGANEAAAAAPARRSAIPPGRSVRRDRGCVRPRRSPVATFVLSNTPVAPAWNSAMHATQSSRSDGCSTPAASPPRVQHPSGRGHHAGDGSHQQVPVVDPVRQHVADLARAGVGGALPPPQIPAAPVLEALRPEVPRLADEALAHEPMHEAHRRARSGR